MALRSLISLRGFIESLPGGYKSINPTDFQNNTPPEAETQLILASGGNSINVPALSKGVVIIFDSTSTVTKDLKGNHESDSVGVRVRKNGWCVLQFDDTPPSSIAITASAEDTGKYTRFIWF